ncbi:Neutral protease 2-like protein [Lachnellula subtilissima]|uniref:Neutral protease 2 n=1 Tax=Lachnellula subtilissima TaxID=602034 RepID=A0A8H8UAT9_9HELO|nr:Neutral protease 2-like protein [Lachnellula subtilissima]
MYFAQASLILAAVANAAFIQNGKRDTGLEVTLTAAEGSAADVIATVKNVGTESLNLLTLGTFLDAAPVQKLAVVDEANAPVAFTGVYRSIQYSNDLSDDYFKLLAAGESGTYSFSAEGAIPFAIGDSKELTDNAVTYKTNVLTMAVDGEAAKLRPKAIPEMTIAERTVLQSGCTTSNKAATTAALSSCASLARAASTAATSGSSTKFSEYFKTTSSSVRSTVAARLSAVATQCGSITSGGTKYYCTDVYDYCESNVLAYTIPSTNEIVNCPLYYSDLPLLSSTCHAQDRATTSLHEMTHAPATYSPGTDDNAYGYSASIALSSASAVLNADTYALYANGTYSNTVPIT